MGTWNPGPGATTGDDTFTGDGTNEVANGLDGNDTLNGNDGDDTLTGGLGSDILNGGNGNDTLVFSQADFGFGDQFNGGANTDTLSLFGTDNTTLEMSGLTLTSIEAIAFNSSTAGFLTVRFSSSQFGGGGISSTADITGFNGQFNGLRITMTSTTFTDTFVYHNWESTDSTLITGTSGGDTITGGAFRDVVTAGDGNDTINASAGANNLSGEGGDDTINGGGDAEQITGGAGNDIIHAGAGSDLIFMSESDQGTTETIDGGGDFDQLQLAGETSNASFVFYNATLTSIEELIFASNIGAGAFVTANFFASQIGTGFANNLTVIGSDAADTLNINGTGTIDLSAFAFSSWSALDIIQINGHSATNDTLIGTGQRDIILGYDGSDSLTGGGGDDDLDGGTGADTMIGGLGDDTYHVDNAGDVVTEALNQGTDSVLTAATFALGANIENLTLTGAGAANGFGNILNNVITGNGAANQLNGFDGNDTLDGSAGADNMFGGNGDDTYYVDNAGDQTTEVSALGGTDTVFSSVARNLTANIENLTLTGVAAITGAGNTLNNVITGNAAANTLYGFDGNDRLDGGAGADTLFGAAGNDTYVVDNINDITVEGSPSGGVDTVESSVSRNLNANFENLTLTGSAQFGYGNILNNVMTGNASANSLYGFDGNDTLDGGAGVDQMFGANGDDTYIVDNAGDVTSEVSALGGIDTVISSVTRNLTANLENLTLSGSAAITGAGNALDNVLIGNSGVNTLYGLDGADTLDGGLGADTLQGGLGADTYVFSSALGAGNVDAIVGFSVVDDTIFLDHAIFTGLVDGGLDAGAFHVGPSAADADDHIIYDNATGALYWDPDGTGAAGQIQFAALATGLALTNTDFIIGGP